MNEDSRILSLDAAAAWRDLQRANKRVVVFTTVSSI